VPAGPGYIEESYRKIAEGLEPIHRAGVIPIVLGGDHSIALPELRAASAVRRDPDKKGPTPGLNDGYTGMRQSDRKRCRRCLSQRGSRPRYRVRRAGR
jgi:agmatinase